MIHLFSEKDARIVAQNIFRRKDFFQVVDKGIDSLELELVADAVGNEARRRVHNRKDFLKIIFAEGGTRFNDVNDTFRHADYRREFNGAVKLDVFHLHALRGEETFGDSRKLRGNACVSIVFKARAFLILRDSHHQMTLAEAQIQKLVNILARLNYNVFSDNADVSRAASLVIMSLRDFS